MASRPPEARAPRATPGQTTRRRPTPRYATIPRWGLRDAVAPAEADGTAKKSVFESLGESLHHLLLVTAAVLGVAAVAQMGVYALLVINRSHPIDETVAVMSYLFTWLTGGLSVAVVVLTAVAFVSWLHRARAKAYAAADRVDPRPLWQLLAGTLVPGATIVFPALFIHELAALGHHLPADRVDRVLRLWWASWAGLNAFGVVILLIRLRAESVQWGANAVLFTVICNLLGAAFAVVSIRLLRNGFDAEARPEPVTRWLAA
ncbi:DUF4328 domain-containing protein [Williamsia sp. CHRR-6]|uniref:DUF4328 domain-containing protein n=1 Tax=Williamsia sp. CHRR-6 TaxID=2835871 RepID=UPI001BDA2F53|nr:DUF4328 domain-containing protein [Williamsia sp. CHRR-6]MBT0567630.1 DUF4328 domain-containing protein [Williamsia sp. CHRR-6]